MKYVGFDTRVDMLCDLVIINTVPHYGCYTCRSLIDHESVKTSIQKCFH